MAPVVALSAPIAEPKESFVLEGSGGCFESLGEAGRAGPALESRPSPVGSVAVPVYQGNVQHVLVLANRQAGEMGDELPVAGAVGSGFYERTRVAPSVVGLEATVVGFDLAHQRHFAALDRLPGQLGAWTERNARPLGPGDCDGYFFRTSTLSATYSLPFIW